MPRARLAVMSVAFSHDGNVVASGTSDGLIELYDSAKGEILKTIKPSPQQGGVRSVAFSADDRFVVAAMNEGDVVTFNVAEGTGEGRIHTQNPASHVCTGKRGNHFAASTLATIGGGDTGNGLCCRSYRKNY